MYTRTHKIMTLCTITLVYLKELEGALLDQKKIFASSSLFFEFLLLPVHYEVNLAKSSSFIFSVDLVIRHLLASCKMGTNENILGVLDSELGFMVSGQ